MGRFMASTAPANKRNTIGPDVAEDDNVCILDTLKARVRRDEGIDRLVHYTLSAVDQFLGHLSLTFEVLALVL